jgi:hypothetical protein
MTRTRFARKIKAAACQLPCFACADLGGVMVLVARLRTISDQIVPETTITPRLKVQRFYDQIWLK